MAEKNIQQEVQSIINEILSHPLDQNFNYGSLLAIGRKTGFLNEDNRKQIWPILLGVNLNSLPSNKVMDEKLKSKFYDQLKKDVDRSISFLDVSKSKKTHSIKKEQDQLLIILEGLMQQQPELQYYQGYHDVATLFLMIFGTRKGFYMSKQAANTFFRDPMVLPLEESAMLQVKLVHRLVKKDDNYLGKVLDDIEGPMFSISWILTWFAHSFTNLDQVQRIYDYLLCSQPYVVAYLSAAFILIQKESLRECLDNCEEGSQVGVVYQFFQNAHLRKIQIDWTVWFSKCEQLLKKYPFRKLTQDLPFSKNSILFTTELETQLTFRKGLQLHLLDKVTAKLRDTLTIKNAGIIILTSALLFQTMKYFGMRQY